MRKRWRNTLSLALPAFGLSLLSGCSHVPTVYNPQGPIARDELHLMEWTYWITGFVVVLVFGLFAFMAIRYRAKKGEEHLVPEEIKDNHKLEIIWTIIPILLVAILAIPTFITNKKVEQNPDPSVKPIVINVTSADWKWIFSYPEQGIETVNYVHIPAGVPVKFKLTSAGTMNTFWVPALGGMKYTMNDMNMDLFLEADHSGVYKGMSGNYSGPGFANMKFNVYATTKEEFNKWAENVKQTAPSLSLEKYKAILKPGNVGKMQFSNTHLKWGNVLAVEDKTGSSSMKGMDMSGSKSETEAK